MSREHAIRAPLVEITTLAPLTTSCSWSNAVPAKRFSVLQIFDDYGLAGEQRVAGLGIRTDADRRMTDYPGFQPAPALIRSASRFG